MAFRESLQLLTKIRRSIVRSWYWLDPYTGTRHYFCPMTLFFRGKKDLKKNFFLTPIIFYFWISCDSFLEIIFLGYFENCLSGKLSFWKIIFFTKLSYTKLSFCAIIFLGYFLREIIKEIIWEIIYLGILSFWEFYFLGNYLSWIISTGKSVWQPFNINSILQYLSADVCRMKWCVYYIP